MNLCRQQDEVNLLRKQDEDRVISRTKLHLTVLIRYRNEIRATYRLGRVQEVRTGKDGHVRTVVLKYKLPTEKGFRTVDRPVQGISVIVPIEEQTPVGVVKPDPYRVLNPSAEEYVPQQQK